MCPISCWPKLQDCSSMLNCDVHDQIPLLALWRILQKERLKNACFLSHHWMVKRALYLSVLLPVQSSIVLQGMELRNWIHSQNYGWSRSLELLTKTSQSLQMFSSSLTFEGEVPHTDAKISYFSIYTWKVIK